MKKLIVGTILLLCIGCKKKDPNKIRPTDPSDPKQRCGVILETPTLDSFVYPTFYITTTVAYKEGAEIVHLQGNVTGDHDGSWYLPRYDKDSIVCTQ